MEHNNIDVFFSADIYNNFYSQVTDLISGVQINQQTIINVVYKAIQLVASYPKLRGVEKKAIVLKVVHNMIEEHVTNDEDKAALTIFANAMAPNLINLICDIDTSLKKTAKCMCF